MSTSQQVDPMIGRLVDGRYRVRARIARGGMATVYVATDLRLERRVALKVMHGHLTDDAVYQSKFIQEARAAARLADPHVVNVFDQGQDADMAYLVMEYLPGITLRELLREQRRLTVAQTVTIMDATLQGLAAAHRAGIVHRDVKPENILLAEDGRIKIGDFGLARATTANTASGAMLLGTIAYLAPELVTRGTADARSDIYALGIMLYEMLAGEQPYKGEQPMQIAYQHATESVPRPSARNPGVPEALDELVLWATEKSPDERPGNAQQMLDRLREIERDLGITPVVTAATSGLPLSDDKASTADLTKVLPAAITAPTTTIDDVDNATKLRRRVRSRRASGAWLMVIVLLLASLAGVGGWWFGSGPGSLVAVPDVSNQTFADARKLLEKNALRAEERRVYDLDVKAGLAVGTDPVVGTRVDKDELVTVLVSDGPRPITIERLTGMTDSEAAAAAQDLGLVVDDERRQVFSSSAEKDVVTSVRLTPRDGEAVKCNKGCEAHEGDTVRFSVSVGAVPDVRGLTVILATRTLNTVNLQVSPDQQEEYSDDVDAGKVIGLVPVDGARRPGQTVQLIVSKGPEPIVVPDVVGQTVHQAYDALKSAGFTPVTSLEGNLLWDLFTVQSLEPGVGTSQLPGTQIKIVSLGQ
ncbi:MAG: Stk1 family PASTA domain-containing Ser/Thr kinase [Microbacterium sp.]|uniref:Stk1 family PASTA domain-containing Ser/Thr kinase n=1 Tax=Microbacterium sp. TaxID=51671 RepID=UPI0039E4E743